MGPETTASAPSGALADPTFRRFLVARAICMAGNAMTMVALPVLVYRLTESATITALVAVIEAAPYLVLGLPAGALVDRWNRRRVVVLTEVGSGLALASVTVTHLVGSVSVVHLLAAALVVSSLFVLGDAATFGLVPQMVGSDRIASATSSLVAVGTAITLVGPLIAGVLISIASPAVAIGIDAAAYLVSAGIVAKLRWVGSEDTADASERRPLVTEIGDGLRFIWQTPVVRWLTVLGIGVSLAGGATSGLLVVIAVEQLGLSADSSMVGWLFAAGAGGTFVSTLILPRAQARLGVGLISTVGYGLALIALLTLAQATQLGLALPVLAVLNFAMTTVIVNGIVTRQVLTPQRLQSRVNTTARLIAWGGSPVGAALAGVVAGQVGTPWALRVAAIGLALSVLGAVWAGLPRLGTLASLDPDQRPDAVAGQGQ